MSNTINATQEEQLAAEERKQIFTLHLDAWGFVVIEAVEAN